MVKSNEKKQKWEEVRDFKHAVSDLSHLDQKLSRGMDRSLKKTHERKTELAYYNHSIEAIIPKRDAIVESKDYKNLSNVVAKEKVY